MAPSESPIRRTLIKIVLLTCGAVVLVMSAGSFVYDLVTFRQTTIHSLATVGGVIASNSTAALAFKNADDAYEVLTALKAEPHVVAAALYTADGHLFVAYPSKLPPGVLPAAPGASGYRLAGDRLIGVEPVVQGSRRLGTLYLVSNMSAFYERLRLFAAMVAVVVLVSFAVAYAVSQSLQRKISLPILALAETAKAVSSRRDYSVRAARPPGQELGLLTDAFNHMLTRISEQHTALAESETRVRAVVNSALSAVVVIDSGGLITEWNPRAEAMFGWAAAEVIGQPLDGFIVPLTERKGHRDGLSRYHMTGTSGILNRLVERTAVRRSGAEFPVEVSVSPLKSGETTTFCGFITDITDRKDAQRRVQNQLSRLDLLHRITRAIGDRQDLASIFRVVARSLEDQMPVDLACLCLYDAAAASLTITALGGASGALATSLGLTEQMKLSVDPNGLSRCIAGHLVYEPDTRKLPFPFPERLAAGGVLSVVLAPLLVESRVFGVLIAARRSPGAFESPDCEFLRQLSEHVGLASHQAQLYGALQQAYDDLRQTQHVVMQQERLRALGQMASGIAHDINNAISPVALYTESLLEREPNLSERARGYLVTIQQAIEDVASTVARMREFYRPREPQLELTRVSLNRTVEQVLELTRARWSDLPQQRGVVITLRVELDATLPDIMGADGEIRDALTNLVFNSIDAMPEGGTLTVRTREVTSPSAEDPTVKTGVYVEVLDTGLGMDEETRRRCLEPFYTTKGERGTGLGLAMVYGMVQRHSAEVDIRSEVGQGTCVALIFARVEIEAAQSAAGAGAVTGAEPRRLLLVDDDPLLIKSLRDILEGDGHFVSTASGGQAGLDVFTSSLADGKPFDAVITDLGMPYVDGRKVAAGIKQVSPTTPVIMLTGWGKRLLADDDIPPFVDRVLSKPPRIADIRRALSELAASSLEPAGPAVKGR